MVRGGLVAIALLALVAACAAAPPRKPVRGAKPPMTATTSFTVDELLAFASTLGQRGADAGPRFGTVTLSMRGTSYVRPTDPRLSTVTLHAAEETDLVHTLSIGAATADRFPRVADLKARLGSFVESARSHYKQPITLVFHVPANTAQNPVAYDLNVELADDGAAALDDRRVVSVTFVGPR
jgi:hypothetical protein